MSTQAVQFTGQHLEVDLDLKSSASASDLSGSTPNSQQIRGYHSFEKEVYYLPNDDTEHTRLDLQDSIWKLCLHGGLHLAPLPPNPKHVVDIGTGTACWAVDFAKAHPETQLLGTDLTPVSTEDKPSNTRYIVANANEPWDFGGQLMDFIHSRTLLLGVPDWTFYFRQAFQHTKPGGWIEVQEPQFPIEFLDDGAVTDTSPMNIFAKHIDEASQKLGVSLSACDDFEKQLKAQGFINIRRKTVRWAVGPWPKDALEKEIGRRMGINLRDYLIPALFSKLLGGVLGLSDGYIQTLSRSLQDDIDNPSTHYYIRFTLCCAQKPL